MNVVHITGNLVKDPELRITQLNKSVLNCTVAVDSHYRSKNNVDKINQPNSNPVYIDCELWDTGAETFHKYFFKGDPVILTGSLKSDKWEKDGQLRSKLVVRVDRFEFPRFSKNRRDDKGTQNIENSTNNYSDDDFIAT